MLENLFPCDSASITIHQLFRLFATKTHSTQILRKNINKKAKKRELYSDRQRRAE